MGFIEKIRDYALSRGYYKDEEDVDVDDQDFDDEDEEEAEPVRESAPAPRTASFEEIRRFKSYSGSSISGGSSAKVYSIHTGTNTQQTVVITYPEGIDDSGYICEYIKSNNTVVVNLDNVKHEMAQRIVDFLSGIVHALEGDIQYISNKIFILAPKNVEITGKIKEELRSGGILATLKTSIR